MRLLSIQMNDFCAYAGSHTIDLSPDSSNGHKTPIVLIGAMNGGGKTTLLDAVRLALYGGRAVCSKRGNKAYDLFLRESINSQADPGTGSSVGLTFEYMSEGQKREYKITRRWWASGGNRIKENVQVAQDRSVDQWLSSNWNQVVEEIIPSGISQLCFFDAEQIRYLAEDNGSGRQLGKAIYSLLGLDLVEQLLNDTAILEKRMTARVSKSGQLQELEGREEELARVDKDIGHLVQKRGAAENELQVAKRESLQADQAFAEVGGTHWANREANQQRKLELVQGVQLIESELVELATSELPLVMLRRQLAAICNAVVARRQDIDAQALGQAMRRRSNRVMKELTRLNLQEDVLIRIGRILNNDLPENTSVGVSTWYGEVSDQTTAKLQDLTARRLDIASARTGRVLSEYRQALEALEDVQRNLAAAPDDATIKSLFTRTTTAAKEVLKIEQLLRGIDGKLEGLRARRSELTRQTQTMRRAIIDRDIKEEEGIRVSGLIVKTQDTMKRFLQRATERKIDRLADLVTERFRFLLHKNGLIEKVTIDPVTFEISVVGKGGAVLPKQSLSEGEKQIFAISLLWGLSQAASRPLPMIIDTPMARLDAQHRDYLVDRYFPNASHQVIILSTDTEVDELYYERLKPYVHRSYRLKFCEELLSSTVHEGYFEGSRQHSSN